MSDHHHASSPQDHGMPKDHHSMHPMAFHFGAMEMILFSFWDINSAGGMFLSCLIVFAGCILLEAIRWFRIYRGCNQPQSIIENNRRRAIDSYLITDTLLHALQILLSYLAMLVFMTFNIWLCASIIFGEVLTHLAFRIFIPHLENAALSSSTQPCCG